MSEFKLIGVTECAEQRLSVDDLEELNNMIGEHFELSHKKAIVDGGKLFIDPFGDEWHESYLKLRRIKPKTVNTIHPKDHPLDNIKLNETTTPISSDIEQVTKQRDEAFQILKELIQFRSSSFVLDELQRRAEKLIK